MTKSIEQLENNVWKEPSEFPTTMVEKCHRFRKISISKLTTEQIRLLISQNIGTELGEKKFDQINEKIKASPQHNLL